VRAASIEFGLLRSLPPARGTVKGSGGCDKSNPRVAAEDGALPESRACLSTRLSPVLNTLQKLDLSISMLWKRLASRGSSCLASSPMW